MTPSFLYRLIIGCFCLWSLSALQITPGQAQVATPITAASAKGRAVPHTPLYSTQSGSRQRANLVIRDAGEFQRVFDVVVRDFPSKPPLPEVDFSQNMVVAILLGDQLALRRFVNIAHVVETSGEQAEIVIEFTVASGRTVDRDGIRITKPTQPSYFYQISKSNLPVAFYNVGAQDLGRNDIESFKDPQGGDATGKVTGLFNELAVANREAVHEDKEAIVKGKEEGLRFLASAVGHNRVALNVAILLAAACFAWLMHGGFMLLQTGLARRGNAMTAMFSYGVVLVAAVTGYWVCGWAFMWGAHGPLPQLGGVGPISNEQARLALPGIGSVLSLNGYFLAGNSYDVGVGVLFFFQAALAALAVAIPLGAWLERVKLPVLALWGFCGAAVLYPFFGHWSWGKGWLAALGSRGLGVGFVDFLGSGVVHALAGIAALVGLVLLGRRRQNDGSNDLEPRPHNYLLSTQGVFVAAVCWVGVSLGAMQGIAGAGSLRIGLVAATMLLAGIGGALAALLFSRFLPKQLKVQTFLGGMLAGMVAVSAPVAFVSPTVGFLIGALGGLLATLAGEYIKSRSLDDPANVVGIHGVAGIWGLIAVGIFADGTFGAGWNGAVLNRQPVPLVGVLSGSVAQLGVQMIGIAALLVWAVLFTGLFFKLAQVVFKNLRIDAASDAQSLDRVVLGIEPHGSETPAPASGSIEPQAPVQHNTQPEFDPFSQPPLVGLER